MGGSSDMFQAQPMGDLLASSDRALTSHARTQAPPLLRPPTGMLAHLFRRCSCRYDCRARRESAREWTCGFYPGSNPGEQQNGTAATFDEARADFESAWGVF